MRRFRFPRGLLDDTDASTRPHRDRRQRPGRAAVRDVRAQRRASGHHRAGATLPAEARRVPPLAVAAGQFAPRRSGRCAVPGSIVSILSSGQRHRARRFVQSRLQHRGAGFPADAYPRRRGIRRYRRQCRHLCDAAGAACRRKRQSDRDRAASRHPCAAFVQPRRVGFHARFIWLPPPPAHPMAN